MKQERVNILFSNIPRTPIDRASSINRFFLSMMMKQPVLVQGSNDKGQNQTCVDIVTGIEVEDGSHLGFIITTRTNGSYYVKA